VDSGPIEETLSNSLTCTKDEIAWLITFFFVSRWPLKHVVIALDVLLITHLFHFLSFGLQKKKVKPEHIVVVLYVVLIQQFVDIRHLERNSEMSVP
jgi:hypothetical protein